MVIKVYIIGRIYLRLSFVFIMQNASVLADWRSENVESMNHLSKLQDLSVDEVKHLRLFKGHN